MDTTPALHGTHLSLELLTRDHLPGLSKHYVQAISLYYPLPYANVDEYYESLLGNKAFGDVRIFAMKVKSTGELVGCTGLFDYNPTHKKVQIGATWVGPEFQGSAANVESKLLLMEYCFSALGCLRVEFMTDSLNTRSQGAMERLGFTKEGVLRNHLLRPDGRRRHTVYYSVIVEEWPAVRDGLRAKIQSRRAPT